MYWPFADLWKCKVKIFHVHFGYFEHCDNSNNLVIPLRPRIIEILLYCQSAEEEIFPHFIFRASGPRPAYVMVRCPSVRMLTFLLKYLLLWNYSSDFDEISQKCSCHGPLQNFLLNLGPPQGLQIFTSAYVGKTLDISLYLAIRPRLTIFHVALSSWPLLRVPKV